MTAEEAVKEAIEENPDEFNMVNDKVHGRQAMAKLFNKVVVKTKGQVDMNEVYTLIMKESRNRERTGQAS